MRKIFALIALALILSACKPGAVVTCTPLKQYSQEFQAAAAAEYEAVEKIAPHLVQMVDDYGLSRKAIRACIKRRK